MARTAIPLCDDVFRDFMHLLKRKEHTRKNANLASRRFYGWSSLVSERYPARILSVEIGVYGSNSLRVGERAAEFPETEPPEDILRFSEVHIGHFVGPEVFQFLRLSARLIDGCHLIFDEFGNFVLSHSTDFIYRFFALLPPNRLDDLLWVPSSAVRLFTDHPAMFSQTKLIICCTVEFPLECLLYWLHLDGARLLTIKILNAHPEKINAFLQCIRQDFRDASRACPFTVEIGQCGNRYSRLAAFDERNADTGERLTLSRSPDNFFEFVLERKAEGINLT